MTTLFDPPPAEAHRRARRTDLPSSREAAARAVTASAQVMVDVERVMADGKPRILAEIVADVRAYQTREHGAPKSEQAIRGAISDLREGLGKLAFVPIPGARADGGFFERFEHRKNENGIRCLLIVRAK